MTKVSTKKKLNLVIRVFSAQLVESNLPSKKLLRELQAKHKYTTTSTYQYFFLILKWLWVFGPAAELDFEIFLKFLLFKIKFCSCFQIILFCDTEYEKKILFSTLISVYL